MDAMNERRRVRLKAMAKELGISDRQIRKWLVNGMPHTKLQGVLWFEPDQIHAWLDKFNREGRPPGIKRTRGMKLVQIGGQEMYWPTEFERTRPIAIGW